MDAKENKGNVVIHKMFLTLDINYLFIIYKKKRKDIMKI